MKNMRNYKMNGRKVLRLLTECDESFHEKNQLFFDIIFGNSHTKEKLETMFETFSEKDIEAVFSSLDFAAELPVNLNTALRFRTHFKKRRLL